MAHASIMEAGLDLKVIGDRKGIKYFLLTAATLKLNEILIIVPIAAIRDVQEHGVGRSCPYEFGLSFMEPETYFVPDPKTLIQLPWKPHMGWLACNIYLRGEPMIHCPRRILQEQIKQAREMGFVFKTGIEPEFQLLKKDEFELVHPNDVGHSGSYYTMRVSEYLMRITGTLQEIGWNPYKVEHEIESNQYEIGFEYADALTTADRWIFVKFMIQELAEEAGMRATFMPKLQTAQEPLGHFNEFHIHHSLWNITEDKEVFPLKDGHLGLSELGSQFLAGELKHMKDLSAIYFSTVNSYKRLGI